MTDSGCRKFSEDYHSASLQLSRSQQAARLSTFEAAHSRAKRMAKTAADLDSQLRQH
jgi:hypothetical protein|tara:strand:- start:481 stop:651 length:171 start_codon:yes stop_codon:yes gene_type:complete